MSWKGCDFRDCNRLAYRKDKLTGLSYCQYHKNYSTDIDKRSIAQKAAARIKEKMSTMPQSEWSIIILDLDMWFDMVAGEIKKNPYCWETGEFIPEKDYRAASCHIFPKSIYLSVATHPLNFLILSKINGSHDKTHRLDTFSKMKVWELAVQRFKIFEPFITEKHKYLNLFREYAEKITSNDSKTNMYY